MLTKSFYRELEGALLRSFARASRKVTPLSQREPNFIGSNNYQEDFVREFMAGMDEKREIIEEEVRLGNYREPAALVSKAFRIVEDKVRREVAARTMNRQVLDEGTFQRMLWNWKNEIGKLFY